MTVRVDFRALLNVICHKALKCGGVGVFNNGRLHGFARSVFHTNYSSLSNSPAPGFRQAVHQYGMGFSHCHADPVRLAGAMSILTLLFVHYGDSIV